MFRLLISWLLLLMAGCILQPENVWALTDSLAISQPINCGQLSIYLVKGPSSNQHYLTIGRALQTGSAVIHENNSQMLWIENRSDTDLYLQAGDIIKGGQQDRMIASDFIVSAHDTSFELQVYCVEHGRSTQRGTEPVATFGSSNQAVPVQHMILVANHELTSRLLTPHVAGLTEPDPTQLALVQSLGTIPQTSMIEDAVQDAIWSDVSRVQSQLTLAHAHSSASSDSITKNISPTSLELTLEHPWVLELMGECTSLGRAIQHNSDLIGAVFCVDGQIVGAHLYCSHELFRDMWPKDYRAASVEAVLLQSDPEKTTAHASELKSRLENILFPTGKTVTRTLDKGRISERLIQLPAGVALESSDTRLANLLVHRTFLPNAPTP